MSTGEKNIPQSSDFEVDPEDTHFSSNTRILRTIDAARVSLTALALLAGITILGVSADALAVYDATHVPASFLLPLWPDDFDLRPTVALVVGSSIVIVVNFISLLFSRVQSVSHATKLNHVQRGKERGLTLDSSVGKSSSTMEFPWLLLQSG